MIVWRDQLNFERELRKPSQSRSQSPRSSVGGIARLCVGKCTWEESFQCSRSKAKFKALSFRIWSEWNLTHRAFFKRLAWEASTPPPPPSPYGFLSNVTKKIKACFVHQIFFLQYFENMEQGVALLRYLKGELMSPKRFKNALWHSEWHSLGNISHRLTESDFLFFRSVQTRVLQQYSIQDFVFAYH